jgi:predicted ester cyclase
MADADVIRAIPTEIFTNGRLDLIDEYFAKDYTEHAAVPPGFPEGREGFRVYVEQLRAAFPDFQLDVTRQYQDGDTYIMHCRCSGTMTGDFMGMPAANKKASWDAIDIVRMSDGKVIEHWGVEDQLSMLQQLGFVPPPPGM